MIYKKNVILNSLDGDERRALLSLECNGNTTTGKLRLYNFAEQPKGIVTLGVYYDAKVIKAGLIYLGGMVYSLNLDVAQLPTDFSCCMLNFVGGEAKPILYSSSALTSGLDKTFASLTEAKNVDDVERILNDNQITYDDNLQNEIEKEIDKNITCSNLCTNDCQTCKYKLFYDQHFQEEEHMEKNEEENHNFYYEMKGHLDKLFNEGEQEGYLESLIAQSKWTKVKLNKGEYYVVGVVYEDNEAKYICYGVPGVYQEVPPKELSGFPVWFPLDDKNPQNFGYWLSYQDAKTGESIKAVVIE